MGAYNWHFHVIDGLNKPYPQMMESYAAALREAKRLQRTEDIDAHAVRRWYAYCEYCKK